MEVPIFALVSIVLFAAYSYGWDEIEVEALLRFKEGLTNGTDLSNWTRENSHQLCSSWEGVTCNNATGHVEELVLARLQGILSPEISKLSFLTRLDLDGGLEGVVPSEIGLLTNLKTLDLSWNSFTGRIPQELCWLTKLETLHLSGNRFVGQIPDRLGMMKRLRKLDLCDTHVNGSIPPSLAHLVNLEILCLPTLSISGTDFGKLWNLKILDLTGEVFPQSIVNCSSLEEFSIQFTGNESPRSPGKFPASIDKLHKLKSLHIFNFNVQIPEEIGNCSKLEGIYIWGIHGLIPRSIFHLPHLWMIDLENLVDSNYWHFPQELLNMTGLEELVLANASLTGRLPNILGSNWTALKHLDLSQNQLQGEVPPHVWQIPDLSLSSNNFTGRIPTLDLSQAHFLDVSNNQLHGEIFIYNSRASLGLAELDLSHNNLTGEIPNTIGSVCESLDLLNLEGNRLQGNIPRGLENCTELSYIGLGKNLLGGNLDIVFTNLTNLRFFSIPDNSFKGEFPVLGTQDSQIDLINMRGNRFSGEIPGFVGQLRSLEFLLLRENMFHGNFPAWLSNMSFIRILDLSGNKLSGNLPSDFGKQLNGFKSSSSKDVHFNIDLWVKGHQYEYFENLRYMTLIDLSSNMLSGEIPSSFGALSYLRDLNLSHNGFSGSIQESLSSLLRLEQLDLSSNNLTGIIPETFKSLDSLEVLNLSWNRLEGRIPFEGQMMTFDNESFKGNPGLCGKPLTKECNRPMDEHHLCVRNEEFATWWNEAISPFGFALGFTVGLVLTSWLVATKM